MKPDWKDAPEWANWLAMDDDGEWFWYQQQPESKFGVWRKKPGSLSQRASREPIKHWTDTLEQRP